MSSVKVLSGYGSYNQVDSVAIKCPFCHAYMTPRYIYVHQDSFMFAECTNIKCNSHFVLRYDKGGFTTVLPNSEPAKMTFSDVVNEISPCFETIYNQAFCAEQIGLNHICGVGYRKALEFLIKDYLMASSSDEEYKKMIKSKFLGNCIRDNVSNEQIKIVAQRAVWLGNDETHYNRVWLDKDVSHLKQLIDLTIKWIESEIYTKRLLEEMPEK